MVSFYNKQKHLKTLIFAVLGLAFSASLNEGLFGSLSASAVDSASGSLDFTVEIPEKLTMTLPSSAPKITYTDMNNSGNFGYSAFSVSVGMNVALRYTLSMYSSSSAATASSLADSSDSTNALPTLSATATVTNLTTGAGWSSSNMNQWGYAIGTASGSTWTFQGVSGSSSSASVLHAVDDSTAQTSNGIATNVILGSMVDLTQLAGSYSTTLNFIAVAEIKDLSTITTMQEMTTAVCAATATPTVGGTTPQYQLTDSRDSKKYWVAKLADGNCWMTQNLDYDLSNSTLQTLSSSTSNVSTNKTLTVANGWTYTDISFYEGGDNYIPGGTGSATSASSLASDDTNLHYHQGNYYNWTAATAGSGTSSVISTDATESICPYGWRLPTSNSYTNDKSFGKLTNTYGITNSANGSSDTSLLNAPLFFVRGGEVLSGSLNYVGGYGLYWSSMALSNAYNAYSLYFYSSNVLPSLDSDRFSGYSVRCVAE